MLNHLCKLIPISKKKLIIIKIIIFFALFSNTIVLAQISKDKEEICESKLAENIEKIVNSDEQKKVFWGISIKNLNTKKNLYQLNADKNFIPASNLKLFITAAALLKFGEDYRIATPVYITGNIPNLTTLTIVGKGDPNLTDKDLKKLADKLKLMGVKQINKLIVEDGYLPPPILNHTWEWTDLPHYYAPPVNSLILNDNVVTLSLTPEKLGQSLTLKWSDDLVKKQFIINNKTFTSSMETNNNIELNIPWQKPILNLNGSLFLNSDSETFLLSIPNPNQYFLDSLEKVLKEKNITILHTKIIENNNNTDNNKNSEEILTFFSPNMRELINKTNQDSDNLYAEVLLKTLAVTSKNNNGVDEIKRILTQLNLNIDNLKIEDASGLSRHNLVTPSSITNLLILMDNTYYAESYRQSLSIAGVNGTLKNRFKNSLITNNLQGKTGTLTGVSALSGYLKILSYPQEIVFSIIINNSGETSLKTRESIDKIILLLSQLKKC